MTWEPEWGDEDAPVNPDNPEDICLPFGKTTNGAKVGGTSIFEPTFDDEGGFGYHFDDLEHLFPLACEVCGVTVPTYHTVWSAYSWWPLGQTYDIAWACSEACAREAQRKLRTELRRAWVLDRLMWRKCAETIDLKHPGLPHWPDRQDKIWGLYKPFREALWNVQRYNGDNT